MKHADVMTKKYMGRPFIFHTPFETTPGWKDGDVGLLVECLPRREFDDVEDLWLAFNVESGKFFEIWGGEAYDDKVKPIVKEHRFLNWKPGSP